LHGGENWTEARPAIGAGALLFRQRCGGMQSRKRRERVVDRKRVEPVNVAQVICPAGSMDTSSNDLLQICLHVLAARCARGVQEVSPKEERAQGTPGACCTRGLVCKECAKKRTRAYRYRRSIPAFPLARRVRSRKTALQTHLARDAAASTATCPNVRDDGQRPSSRDRMAGV